MPNVLIYCGFPLQVTHCEYEANMSNDKTKNHCETMGTVMSVVCINLREALPDIGLFFRSHLVFNLTSMHILFLSGGNRAQEEYNSTPERHPTR